MPQQLRMFAQNIWLLVTGLVLLVVAAAAGLAAYVGLRYLGWRWRVKRARQRELAARYRADGTLYPPQGEGLCQRCSRVAMVYFLADGGKLCSECYEAVYPLGASPASRPPRSPAQGAADDFA